jgi:subtilase family serine protease
MKPGKQVCAITLCAAAVLFSGRFANAQKPQVGSRVVDPVDETRIVKTYGNVHPLARTEFDRGALGDSEPMTRMLLLLQRSDDQEASLRQLMEDQQTKGSANYHNWLTPAQFGAQFGPSDADLQAVTDWLTRQGFQLAKVSAGRTTIEFSGTAGQVRKAFQTEIHRFSANGKEFVANVSDPAIPAALAPVVRGVVALQNYPKQAHVRPNGQYRRVTATGQLTPLFTFGNPANYALAPADFNTIYHVPAGADGTGQTIAVVGQSNVNTQDIVNFRSLFGLPAYSSVCTSNLPPQCQLSVIVNGPDPGLSGGDEGESDLDLQWAGALAPNANIVFVTSQSTMSNPSQITGGVDLSALYVIDNNLAPVMSESYGGCEGNIGTAGNAFYNLLWEQAAAQGITVAVSAGDNGSAGCDDPNSEIAATQGLAVNGVASTPFDVAVGGTDFNPTTLPVTPPNQYWSGTNNAMQGSALSYIPETPWNDSVCATNYPTACATVDSTGGDLMAASGGPSNCAILNGSSCSQGYPMPSYQTGVVPSTFSNRVIPDVSFFASNGANGVAVIVCQADVNPNGAACSLDSPYTDFSLVGGTSASTPAFAAVMAMVNQKTGQRQGNANYALYFLAKNDPNYAAGKCNAATPPAASCVFNDVVQSANTTGVQWNNTVACVTGSPNCSNPASGYGILVANGNPAYAANAGYDATTGLGSINVTNLLNSWSTFSRAATTTKLSSPSGTTNTSGQNFTVTVTVTPSSATGIVSLIATTPTGTVAIGANSKGLAFALSNGTVTATTNLLPPGTTAIAASYGGDATHAGSTSTPIPVTVNGSNQASKTTLSFVTFDSNNNPVLSTASQNVPYGSSYILQVAVTGTNGAPCSTLTTTPSFPCATGTIALADNGAPLNDYPNGTTSNATNTAKLNNVGIAEDQPVQLSTGSHSIVASYAGDANFNASTSNTLSVTLTKAATTTIVASSAGTITSGQSVTIQMIVTTISSGLGPTGNITFTNGGTSLGPPVACSPTSGTQNTSGANGTTPLTAFCTASLTTSAISALFPGPANRPTAPSLPIVLFALALALFLGLVRSMPENRRRAYGYTGLLAFAILAGAIAGCGGGGGSGGGGTGKTVTITATYPGDSNYTNSSGTTTIQVQ